jgi:hypothetical protein
MDSNEPATGSCARAATPVIVGWGVREIELFAGHGGVLCERSPSVQSNFSAHRTVSDKKKQLAVFKRTLTGGSVSARFERSVGVPPAKSA